jgi:primosomal protein N' (replication factor Y) (superfamily II helicase)
MPVARVALDVPLPKLFDYACEAAPPIGARVLVPFGAKQVVGVVCEIARASEVPAERLRPLGRVLEDTPPLPAEWLELARFASDYYQRPLGEVIAGALPPRLKRAEPLRARAAAATPSAETRFTPGPALTAAQIAAIEALQSALGRYAAHVLYGVTGSGKTEVYLHVVRAALERGTQALVLVPEINLTPQLERELRERFPGVAIALAHSGLADTARARAWLAAQAGGARIVLGTRLAVFTPMHALGVVIVDEEHDASFKQQDGVRYSARDLAVYKAHLARCPVVLGSATPSLETFANALADRYRLLRLPDRARAEAALPTVRLVDTRRDAPADGLAPAVVEAIGARLARGEQSLVFLNRRGYAPVLACSACGWVGDCTRCSAHLVVHLGERRLRCHHCGLEAPVPRACPNCGNVDLTPFGRGTQRLEDSIVARFRDARVLRIDSDSARGKGRWEAMLRAIRAGDVDILVGTQILAKGHDFPRLTLVAVANADAALMAADYRAPERLFAQLQQVAGRAGRAELPGEVLIQTRYPEHPIYQALVAGDYERFARAQLEERAAAGFPPAVAEAVLRAEARELDAALAFLAHAITRAPTAADDAALFDPVAMTMPRLAGWERAHVLVQSRSRRALQNYLSEWIETLYAERAPRGVRWHVDVDPVEF